MLENDPSGQKLPEFDGLADLFVQAGALCSPAEFHGVLCGHLAAGGRYAPERWLETAAGMLDIPAIGDEALAAALQQLYQVSLHQLSAGEFQFSLLTPDDDTAIAQRAEALGQWCHGFLSGYGMAGGALESKLSEDARDSVRDLAQIASIAAEADEDGDEGDFVEVYEYVRMSAMLIFSECNRPVEKQTPTGESLH